MGCAEFISGLMNLPYNVGSFPIGLISERASLSYSSIPGNKNGLTFKFKNGKLAKTFQQWGFGRVQPFICLFMTTNSDKVMYSVVADTYYLDNIDKFMELLVEKTK